MKSKTSDNTDNRFEEAINALYGYERKYNPKYANIIVVEAVLLILTRSLATKFSTTNR